MRTTCPCSIPAHRPCLSTGSFEDMQGCNPCLLQRDPLVEYKLEGYNLFLEMMANIRRNVIYNVYVFQPRRNPEASAEHSMGLECHSSQIELDRPPLPQGSMKIRLQWTVHCMQPTISAVVCNSPTLCTWSVAGGTAAAGAGATRREASRGAASGPQRIQRRTQWLQWPSSSPEWRRQPEWAEAAAEGEEEEKGWPAMSGDAAMCAVRKCA